MSNRLFFYIGAELIGAVDPTGSTAVTRHCGFEAAAKYFYDVLKPRGDWLYLLEVSADNDAKQAGLTNMSFRLFAPWKSGAKIGGWYPPGKADTWTPPDYLGRPFNTTGGAAKWEFVCTSIKKNARSVEETATVTVARTMPRTTLTTTKTAEAVTLNGKAVSDCSGRVLKSEYDEFIDELKTVLPFPMMSISDCNTFHTTGYLWGKYAIDRSRAAVEDPGAVLIIDVDQHNDAGSEGTGLVASDGWGHPLIACYPKAAYVVIGTAAPDVDTINIYSAIHKGAGVKLVTPKKAAPRTIPGMGAPKTLAIQSVITPKLLREGKIADIVAAFEKLWTDLEGLLGDEARFKHLYITIDRDSMFGSRTQWGDRDVTFKDPAEIIKVIDVVLYTMAARGVGLAGFDVTGLPDMADMDLGVPSKLLNNDVDRRRPSEVAASLKEEIKNYCELFDSWSSTPARYRIQASGLNEDDSLQLTYSLKHERLGIELKDLLLDENGRAELLATSLSDWRIRFHGLSTSYSSIVAGETYMLTGARYTYRVSRA